MEFLLSEDQLALAETVRDYLAGTHGPEVLRRLDETGPRDPAIWQGLVDMGLTGLLVPSEHGGLGLTLLDAALVARECGRAALAEPLVDAAFVAVPWMLAKGETADMEAIVAGAVRPAAAHAINPWVADGEGPPLDSVDPLRRLATPATAGVDDPYLLDLGALMAAAQLVGAAEAMLHQSVEYAKVRTQFGQPIGAFQAVKHQLATATVGIEFALPVLWRAAQALADRLSSAAVHVSHAKVAASDAAIAMAETAIQIHGAMGYTYEVDLHFWMKRSWALAGAWGSRAWHIRRLEAAIVGGSHPIGPDHTFA